MSSPLNQNPTDWLHNVAALIMFLQRLRKMQFIYPMEAAIIHRSPVTTYFGGSGLLMRAFCINTGRRRCQARPPTDLFIIMSTVVKSLQRDERFSVAKYTAANYTDMSGREGAGLSNTQQRSHEGYSERFDFFVVWMEWDDLLPVTDCYHLYTNSLASQDEAAEGAAGTEPGHSLIRAHKLYKTYMGWVISSYQHHTV